MERISKLIIFSTLVILAFGAESDYLPGVGSPSPTQIYYNSQILTTTKCQDFDLKIRISLNSDVIDIGTTRVCNTRDDIYVGIYADTGLSSLPVKAWLETYQSSGSVPISDGFPSADQFSLTYTPETPNYLSFRVSFSDIVRSMQQATPTCITQIVIYVRAVCGQFYCWGGNDFSGSTGTNIYSSSIVYTPSCPAVINCQTRPYDPECPDYKCETAFALGNIALWNLPNAQSNRWGWAYRTTSASVTIPFDIYGGAAQNDISKGKKVGNLTYTYNANQNGRTDIYINSEWQVVEYHCHISDSAPAQPSAPGQYVGQKWAGTKYAPYPSNTISCQVSPLSDSGNDGVWFVTHLSVCQ